MKEFKIPFQSTISNPPVSLPKHKKQEHHNTHSISILIGGAAGTGIMTLENILSDAFKRSGFFVFSTKEYMSRVRGGSNTTLLRISDGPINAPCWHVDLFIALDSDAISHVHERLTIDTIVMADENIKNDQIPITSMPMLKTVKKVGDIRYANSYVAGVLFGMFGITTVMLSQSIKALFDEHNPQENETAMEEGFAYGKNLDNLLLPKLPNPISNLEDSMHMINGSSASGFGFLAGG